MFGFSFSEILVVAIVALIAFGPERLPKVLSQFGKITGELKKTSDSLRREFYNSSYPPAEEKNIIDKNFSNLKVETKTEDKIAEKADEKTNEEPKS